MGSKGMGVLKDAAPEVRRVAVLFGSDSGGNVAFLRSAESCYRRLAIGPPCDRERQPSYGRDVRCRDRRCDLERGLNRLLRHLYTLSRPAGCEGRHRYRSDLAVFEAGADEYLIKPIDHLALVARVKSALRMKELHDRVVGQAADLAVWNRELEQRVTDQVGELERVGRLRRFLAPQIAEAIVRLSLMNVALQRMSVI
jgi:hypothetical protein